MQDKIKQILSSLPRSPWVYQFFNNSWKIIYIWKSVNLKARVNSYFNGKAKLNFAKQKMVWQIDDIKYIVTQNETESLILETNLIKKHSPKYNILMKDGKNHIYIKITDEPIPKIIKTRKKNDSWTYFWPYISTNYVNNVLKLIRRTFWYRSCDIKFKSKDIGLKQITNPKLSLSNIWNTKIPCIDYYIKKCAWPCLLQEENIKKYLENIENIKDFLNWNTAKIKTDLEQKMKKKAKNLEFEEAWKIKENLKAIASIEENQIVREWVNWDFNVVNFIAKFEKFYVALMEIRDSKITGFYNYEIENSLEESDEEILKSFVEKDFVWELQEITTTKSEIIYILPFAIDFENLPIKTEIPKIWTKKELLDMSYRNVYEYAYKSHLNSLSIKGFSKKNMQNLLEILWYKEINKSIIFECNDISHISWNYTVASRSVIENGKTNPNKYRKLKIKTLEEQKINDFDSMREVITRRLKEVEKTSFIPDLIIIDGWKWQLSSVVWVIENFLKNKNLSEEVRKLIWELQIVSIAKKEEELFLPSVFSPLNLQPIQVSPTLPPNQGRRELYNETFKKIVLDKTSSELKLVQKIRDEAHRFAITFNRDSRIKASKKNILESLPWFWAVTRKKLLRKYGSVENLKNISKEELKEILNKNQIETLDEHMLI